MRNVVISGSASGIGLATKEKLESEGDRVVGIDVRNADVIADLSTPNGRAEATIPRRNSAKTPRSYRDGVPDARWIRASSRIRDRGSRDS